ncbi:MAG: dihydroorotate dehydrogenase-like protein [Nitriliruptor sp.]|uniref:dihydroorotate dehydrogenase-like protein n=1 Tax=Nitriliruptor sp. TaxID=2448056 RepID=UPI00349FE1BA
MTTPDPTTPSSEPTTPSSEPTTPGQEHAPWDLDAEAWSELLSGPGRAVPVGDPAAEAPSLATSYLGLELRSPLVASSSPMTADLSALRALDAAGVGAVVLPSLFEEQVEHELGQLEHLGQEGHGVHAEAPTGYRPKLDGYNTGAVRYLELVRAAKRTVSVPVIASLNGTSPGGWVRFSRAVAVAGADAIEVNILRVVAEAATSGREVEGDALEVVESVARVSGLPVAVKLAPAWSALPSFACRLVDAGAAGLVLFGRAPHLAVDTATLGVHSVFGLSHPMERAEPLRWTAILRGQVEASLAASGGVRSGQDAAELVLVGADVVMLTSGLLERGPGRIGEVADDLSTWLQDRGYASVGDARGRLSQERVADRSAFQRSQYLSGLTAYASTFRS